MHEDYGRLLATSLTLRRVEEDGIESLIELYRAAVEAQPNPGASIGDHPGALMALARDPRLFDSWFLISCVTMFAHGAAVGRGGDQVATGDAELARSSRCNKAFPACFRSVLASVDEHVQWVRGFTGGDPGVPFGGGQGTGGGGGTPILIPQETYPFAPQKPHPFPPQSHPA